ncbi:MAG: hypothetical protein LBD97_01730 [Bifidobacteriaceae bacterium]|jgi:hypothetical protein|nr:hypothetical protein [Bifidobacteriaceae bacterium]
MGLAQTATADRSLAQGKSAQDVEAAIAAWLSVVGDRNSRLRRALRGGPDTEPDPDDFLNQEFQVDHALLKRLLIGLTRLPA